MPSHSEVANTTVNNPHEKRLVLVLFHPRNAWMKKNLLTHPFHDIVAIQPYALKTETHITACHRRFPTGPSDKVPVRYRPNAASGGWSYGRDLAHRREKGYIRFDIISLNIHKTTSQCGWKSRAQDYVFAWLLYFDLDC